jgi:hypothetical protein
VQDAEDPIGSLAIEFEGPLEEALPGHSVAGQVRARVVYVRPLDRLIGRDSVRRRSAPILPFTLLLRGRQQCEQC